LAPRRRILNPLLISLLGIILLPLFIGSWRGSLLGLAAQGALMALVRWHLEPGLRSAADWLALIDLAVLRGALAPLLLSRVFRARAARARNDVLPPDLFSWALAIAIVLVSFSFAGTLVEPRGEQQTLVAVASASLMLGFLVLSTVSDPLSQVLGALRIENAIALFELGGEQHAAPPFVRCGLIGVLGVTVALFAWHLGTLSSLDGNVLPADAEPEGPTL
jgi:hydrogenase-4 membrane subunit HyfE